MISLLVCERSAATARRRRSTQAILDQGELGGLGPAEAGLPGRGCRHLDGEAVSLCFETAELPHSDAGALAVGFREPRLGGVDAALEVSESLLGGGALRGCRQFALKLRTTPRQVERRHHLDPLSRPDLDRGVLAGRPLRTDAEIVGGVLHLPRPWPEVRVSQL